MTDELVFYTNPMSRGRIARWMLEETGHPYRTELLDYASSMKAAAYLRINPMGKVPAITHGDQVVTEAAAICAYLADAFPDANLAPAHGSKQRAAYYRWLFFGAGPLEHAIINTALGHTVPEGKSAMAGYGSLALTIDTLEQAVSGGAYILGDTFSAADVYIGSQIGFGLMFGSIEKRPAFVDYAARIQARPAAKRAVDIDNALMPQQAAAQSA
jgi:glutathione S-transferase